jgi:hypothetical protein
MRTDAAQAFASHFSDVTHRFSDDFVVYLEDEPLSPQNWVQTIVKDHLPTVHLHLTRRYWDVEPGVLNITRLPDWIDIDHALDRIQPRIFEGADYDETEDLAKHFREFDDVIRRKQDKNDGSHNDGVTGGNDATANAAGSPVDDSTSGTRTTDSRRSRSGANGEEERISESPSSHVYTSDGKNVANVGSDRIYSLPKSSTQAVVLAQMGLSFMEEAQEFVVTSGLNRLQLFNIMRLTRKLETLTIVRGIICDTLGMHQDSVRDEGNVTTPSLRSSKIETADNPASRKLVPETISVFDEDLIYEACPRMTSVVFHSELSKWKSESIAPPAPAAKSDHVDGFSSKSDTWAFCKLLGCRQVERMDSGTGNWTLPEYRESESTSLEPLLYGLKLMGSTLKVITYPGDLKAIEEKGRAAIFAFVTALHQALESGIDTPARVSLNSAARSLARLFEVLNQLDGHALTIEMVYDVVRPATAVAQASLVSKHLVNAALMATRALTELKGCSKVIEAEVVRRKSSKVNASSKTSSQMDYDRVRECASSVYGLHKVDENDDTAKPQQKVRFDQMVGHLEELGWGNEAARIILQNECLWSRVAFHANAAAKLLEASFKDTLRADPSKDIRWKAAALPTDLVALLVSRLLWRPVFDGQDALDMYNQYTTDLVSIR